MSLSRWVAVMSHRAVMSSKKHFRTYTIRLWCPKGSIMKAWSVGSNFRLSSWGTFVSDFPMEYPTTSMRQGFHLNVSAYSTAVLLIAMRCLKLNQAARLTIVIMSFLTVRHTRWVSPKLVLRCEVKWYRNLRLPETERSRRHRTMIPGYVPNSIGTKSEDHGLHSCSIAY